MTDREKIELIKRATSMLEDELTTEEYNFLYGCSWDDLPAEEKRLWYTAWREKPDTIEHAAAQCKPGEVKAAARVLRGIRDYLAQFGFEKTLEQADGAELLDLMERTAEVQEAQEAAEAQQPQELKPCPFCGGNGYIVWNARRTARTGTGKKEVTGACVYCDTCAAEIFTTQPHLAAAMWNNRSEGGEKTAEE